MITHVQTLNVHFGGTLWQHKPHEYSDSRSELVHSVDQYYNVNTKVYDRSKKCGSFRTNSLHHQSIRTLGKGLVASCIHHKDETPEAIMHETLPIHAVQYHPEEIYDNYSVEIIKNLLTVKKKNEQQ